MPPIELTSQHKLSVKFRLEAVPFPTKKTGKPAYKDMEVCEVWVPGVKTVGGNWFPAHDVYVSKMDAVTGEYDERTYAQYFNAEYLAFKNGGSRASIGIPLEEAPFLLPTKRMELKALHVESIDQLAGLDGSQVKQLGMGGRELVKKAQEFMEAYAKSHQADYLEGELAKRDAELAEMRTQIAALSSKSSEPVADTDTAAAFKDHTDDDLRNWLTEAGVNTDGRWGRARMLTEAQTILDRDGKKKAA